jgi:uncharacterized lipoprotein YmbA
MRSIAPRLAACATLAAALCACSSPSSRFYTLGEGAASVAAPSAAASASAPANPALLIEVPPVGMPSPVARNQMVMRADASRVDVLEQSRWVSPPGDEIRRALSGDLARRLGTLDVSGMPNPSGLPVYRVSVNVQRFESWPGSRAVLEAVWGVRAVGSRASLTCRTLATEPVGPGIDALVDGHRRAVDQMSADIADGIRALAAARPLNETPGQAASEAAKAGPPPVPCPAAVPVPAPAASAPAAAAS